MRVPHGYPTGNVPVSEKSAILGDLIRAIARFSAASPGKNWSEHGRDGFLKGSNGRSAVCGGDGADISYSSLSLYTTLIRRLLDPRLLALMRAPGLTTQFDDRYISRNLHRATFLPDGTPIFDQLWVPRLLMRRTGNDIVGLACWLALDGLAHLFPDSADREIGASLRSEWVELARRFAADYSLPGDASLFSGKRKDALWALQSVLGICRRRNPPVSSDAHELVSLLDDLLNRVFSQSGGDILGLKGFYHVWEAACLEHAIEKWGLENICTCDDTHLAGIDSLTRKRWKSNRTRLFEANGIARSPDLVVKIKDDTCLIVDFKYQAESVSAHLSESESRPKNPDINTCKEDAKKFRRDLKAYQDITNIEIYRWLLMQNEFHEFDESGVHLELWVPGGEEQQETCRWMNGLAVVFKPVRKLLQAYAGKFRLSECHPG